MTQRNSPEEWRTADDAGLKTATRYVPETEPRTRGTSVWWMFSALVVLLLIAFVFGPVGGIVLLVPIIVLIGALFIVWLQRRARIRRA
jgi:Flp pilus assembly protein TadB